MNARPILIASILTLLAAPLHAADTSDPEEASREQIEHKMEQAQERLEQASREISKLSMQLNDQPWMGFGASRALLGINVGAPMSGTADRTGGVRILSVSHGGPADVAGLKANDVIVSFQGKELRGDQTHTPRQQLLALMRDVGPDAPVAVEFQREGKRQTTQIVPKSLTGFVDESLTRGLDSLKNLGSMMGMHDSSGFGSAEFLDLSPELGGYFGRSKGLLGVGARKDQRLGLQDGDVILDIDGRIPTSGSHALQILNSYRAGETLKLHIMRQQKRVELPVEIPADPDHGA